MPPSGRCMPRPQPIQRCGGGGEVPSTCASGAGGWASDSTAPVAMPPMTKAAAAASKVWRIRYLPEVRRVHTWIIQGVVSAQPRDELQGNATAVPARRRLAYVTIHGPDTAHPRHRR